MTRRQENLNTKEPAPSVWAQDLLGVLHRQNAMLDDLLSHARQQATLIAQGRIDELLGLLARRQQIVEAFGENQQRLGDLTGDLASQLAQIDPEQRKTIKSLITSVGEGLASVLEIDEHDQSEMEGGMSQVRDELKALDASRRAHGAYAPNPSAASGRTQHAVSEPPTRPEDLPADPKSLPSTEIPVPPARNVSDGSVPPRFADQMG